MLAALTTGNRLSALEVTVKRIVGKMLDSLAWYFSAGPTVSTYTLVKDTCARASRISWIVVSCASSFRLYFSLRNIELEISRGDRAWMAQPASCRLAAVLRHAKALS